MNRGAVDQLYDDSFISKIWGENSFHNDTCRCRCSINSQSGLQFLQSVKKTIDYKLGLGNVLKRGKVQVSGFSKEQWVLYQILRRFRFFYCSAFLSTTEKNANTISPVFGISSGLGCPRIKSGVIFTFSLNRTSVHNLPRNSLDLIYQQTWRYVNAKLYLRLIWFREGKVSGFWIVFRKFGEQFWMVNKWRWWWYVSIGLFQRIHMDSHDLASSPRVTFETNATFHSGMNSMITSCYRISTRMKLETSLTDQDIVWKHIFPTKFLNT